MQCVVGMWVSSTRFISLFPIDEQSAGNQSTQTNASNSVIERKAGEASYKREPDGWLKLELRDRYQSSLHNDNELKLDSTENWVLCICESHN